MNPGDDDKSESGRSRHQLVRRHGPRGDTAGAVVAAHVVRCGGSGRDASEHGIATGGAPEPTPTSRCAGGHATAADDSSAQPAAGAYFLFYFIKLAGRNRVRSVL